MKTAPYEGKRITGWAAYDGDGDRICVAGTLIVCQRDAAECVGYDQYTVDQCKLIHAYMLTGKLSLVPLSSPVGQDALASLLDPIAKREHDLDNSE